jgi:indolepyruvate ferredoxin oxidoreductase
VNEELGATAVWGTQQLDLYPQKKKYDGVFGIWYGKGPGVDRCSTCSSTPTWPARPARRRDRHRRRRPHGQEQHGAAPERPHLQGLRLPVFFPSNVQDILDMGLHAFAMSRFSGVWSA